MYGLSETSGVEIEEYEPEISDLDSVRSAIGQGTNNFTTVSLARYVTTVANGGTCYNLTLIDKIMDHNGETPWLWRDFIKCTDTGYRICRINDIFHQRGCRGDHLLL